ncbi:type II secretion system F family protein [candidate division KSB1 bacterium]|nr:type II secretion system F family protein [candidate division KSB1 bacterium]
MPDFRFDGTTMNGRPVVGTITADNLSAAKKKINQLAEKKKVKITQVLKRRTFMYKVKKEGEKPVSGEQKAFTKEEVRQALVRLGFEVLTIQPKVLDFKLKPPMTDVVTFVRVSSDLIREKLPYAEVLQLLIQDIQNPTLRDALKEINNDLRQGRDSEEAFVRQEGVLGKFTARMLGLASKSGNMADMYESTAKFLERNAEFKKNLKSALIMPLFTLLILFGAVGFYVAYIFPETAKLFVKLGTELPPMTTATLKLSDFLINNIVTILLISFGSIGGVIYFFSTPKGKFLLDKYMIKIPVMGTLIHKTTIEIFCRVFYALYSGSGENVDALRLAAEACGNSYMEHRIKTISIPEMLSKGRGLVEALEASGVFTKTALSRFHSGAETGTVRKSAEQIANYYEKETVYKLKNAVDFVQVIIAMIIMMVMTALTLVSSETAMISPKSAM